MTNKLTAEALEEIARRASEGGKTARVEVGERHNTYGMGEFDKGLFKKL